jgi:hypothetical protein
MNVVDFRFFAPSSKGDGESIPANTRASEASAELCESFLQRKLLQELGEVTYFLVAD